MARSPDDTRAAAAHARVRGVVVVALLGIVSLALALRFTGISFLLPHLPEPDGIVLYTQVRAIDKHQAHPEREIAYAFYPLVVAHCVTVFPVARPPAPDSTLAQDLAFASDVHLRSRATVAILSVLSVLATFVIAHTFLPVGWALLAAAFLATSVLNLWFAQQARPHAAAASFAALAVVAALALAQRGRVRDYLACGLASALAVGALQSGVAVLLPFAIALVVRRTAARQTRTAWAFASVAIVAVGVRVFYPYLFAVNDGGNAAPVDLDGSNVNLSGHVVMLGLFNGRGFAKVFDALASYEPWMSALAAIGLACAVQRWVACRESFRSERARDLAIVLAHALPYLLVIGLYQRTYQRFVLPLLPYLACLAAYGVMRAAQGLARVLNRRTERSPSSLSAFAALCMVALFLGPQLDAAIALVRLRSRADTATLAAEWIREHTRPGRERIALLPSLDLPLARSRQARVELPASYSPFASPWIVAQIERTNPPRGEDQFDLYTMPIPAGPERAQITVDPVDFVRSLRADLAVIEVFDPAQRPVPAAIRSGLARVGRLVQRFSPDGEDASSNVPLAYQDDEMRTHVDWCWRARRAQATGPVIEIYDLR